MHTIHKYPIKIINHQLVSMPEHAEITCVGLDPHDNPCIWAEVETSLSMVEYDVYVVGTGQPIPSGTYHAGSFGQNQFIWHIYIK
jgi:hypothetical protein